MEQGLLHNNRSCVCMSGGRGGGISQHIHIDIQIHTYKHCVGTCKGTMWTPDLCVCACECLFVCFLYMVPVGLTHFHK